MNRFLGLTMVFAGFFSTPAMAEGEKGFLGIGMKDGKPSGAIVTTLLPDRAGAKAGLQPGDLIVRINQRPVRDQFDAVNFVKEFAAHSTVEVTIIRQGKQLAVPVVLDAHPTAKFSKVPMQPAPNATTNSRMTRIGARMEVVDAFLRRMMRMKEGVYITEVAPGSAAAKAGLKANDVILRIDNRPVASLAALDQAFAGKQPGQSVTMSVVRAGKRYRAVVAIDAQFAAR